MRHYSLFHPLYLAFYSKSLYKDVAKNWKGTGLAYLLLLLALAWIPVMIVFHYDLSREITREAPPIINQVPKVTITRGEVSVDAPVPYIIIEPKTGAQLMVIDTSGRIASPNQTPALVLLTKKQLFVKKQRQAETRIYDLSSIESLTIDRERVNGWAEAFRKWFAFAAYPFTVIGLFIYRLVQMLIYALIGMLFAKIVKANLEYVTLIRLAAVSITPVIILNAARRMLDISIPYVGLLSFLIAMGYLFFAVKAGAEREAGQPV